jgi:hypothetical protein
MGESAKAVLALLFIVFCIAAAIAWADPNIHFAIDVGLTLAALIPLLLLLYSLLRRDKAFDFLYHLVGNYFERDGFQFAVVPRIEASMCQIAILFQNRYSNRCEAQVFVKPSQEFFMTRRPIDHLSIGVVCDGGAFGAVLIPWGVPKQFQGKKQNLDIGASVRYPQGKGQMLRFRDGTPVKGPTLSAFQIATTVAAAAGGMIVAHSPARMAIQLPHNVADHLSDDSPISTVTLWRPGDPESNVELPGDSSD